MVSAREATTDFHTAEPAEIITQIMADDARFVIETLGEINAGKVDSAFQGRLNLDQIGVLGHSMGGAVAYNLAIHDSRVKAAINLDGRVYITPKDHQKIAPFLMLASDAFYVSFRDRSSLLKSFDEMTEKDQQNALLMYGNKETYQEAYARDYQNMLGLIEVLEASGNLFMIEGCEHMKFTDIGIFIGDRRLRELLGIGGKADPVICLEITRAVTLAFFDRYLKGEPGASLESTVNKYPELEQVDLKKPQR
jgi:pimeloyl-ACP methyl ester carboxylesterase